MKMISSVIIWYTHNVDHLDSKVVLVPIPVIFSVCFSVNIDSSISECDGLHARWQAHHHHYFSSSLADLEHRILLAEDSMKKHKPVPAPPDQSYAHRSLR